MVSRVTRRHDSHANVEVTATLHARTVARLQAENAALRAMLTCMCCHGTGYVRCDTGIGEIDERCECRATFDRGGTP